MPGAHLHDNQPTLLPPSFRWHKAMGGGLALDYNARGVARITPRPDTGVDVRVKLPRGGEVRGRDRSMAAARRGVERWICAQWHLR